MAVPRGLWATAVPRGLRTIPTRARFLCTQTTTQKRLALLDSELRHTLPSLLLPPEAHTATHAVLADVAAALEVDPKAVIAFGSVPAGVGLRTHSGLDVCVLRKFSGFREPGMDPGMLRALQRRAHDLRKGPMTDVVPEPFAAVPGILFTHRATGLAGRVVFDHGEVQAYTAVLHQAVHQSRVVQQLIVVLKLWAIDNSVHSSVWEGGFGSYALSLLALRYVEFAFPTLLRPVQVHFANGPKPSVFDKLLVRTHGPHTAPSPTTPHPTLAQLLLGLFEHYSSPTTPAQPGAPSLTHIPDPVCPAHVNLASAVSAEVVAQTREAMQFGVRCIRGEVGDEDAVLRGLVDLEELEAAPEMLQVEPAPAPPPPHMMKTQYRELPKRERARRALGIAQARVEWLQHKLQRLERRAALAQDAVAREARARPDLERPEEPLDRPARQRTRTHDLRKAVEERCGAVESRTWVLSGFTAADLQSRIQNRQHKMEDARLRGLTPRVRKLKEECEQLQEALHIRGVRTAVEAERRTAP